MRPHSFYNSKESLEETNNTRKLSGFPALTNNIRCIHCGTWEEKFTLNNTLPCSGMPIYSFKDLMEGTQVSAGYPLEPHSVVAKKINDMFSPKAVDKAILELFKKDTHKWGVFKSCYMNGSKELGCVHCSATYHTVSLRSDKMTCDAPRYKFKDLFDEEVSHEKSMRIPDTIIPSFQCYKQYTHEVREQANRPLGQLLPLGVALARALLFPIPASERREDYLSPFKSIRP